MPPERVSPKRTRRQTERGAQYREEVVKTKERSKTQRRLFEARKQFDDLADSFKKLKIEDDVPPPPPAVVEAVRDDMDDLADSFSKLRIKTKRKTRKGGKHRSRRHRKTHRR
jgi:molecular chaperone DnaK (HSP70)